MGISTTSSLDGRSEGAEGLGEATPVAQARVKRPPVLPPLTGRARVLQWWEIASVFAVSLGASGVYAFVSYIGSLTARQSLSSQQAVINGSHAPGRPLLDLFLQ